MFTSSEFRLLHLDRCQDALQRCGDIIPFISLAFIQKLLYNMISISAFHSEHAISSVHFVLAFHIAVQASLRALAFPGIDL